jgi:hypothetical protein
MATLQANWGQSFFGMPVFQLPYVDKAGDSQTFTTTNFLLSGGSTTTLTTSGGKSYTDAEWQTLKYLYLAQAFATLFCQQLEVGLPAPVLATGAGSLTFDYGTKLS